jgi:hypothetical protein
MLNAIENQWFGSGSVLDPDSIRSRQAKISPEIIKDKEISCLKGIL